MKNVDAKSIFFMSKQSNVCRSHLAHALPPTGGGAKPKAGGILSSRPPTAPGNRPASPAPSRLHMQATATATRRGDKSSSPPPSGGLLGSPGQSGASGGAGLLSQQADATANRQMGHPTIQHVAGHSVCEIFKF